LGAGYFYVKARVKLLVRAIILLAAIVATGGVVFVVLLRNHAAGVYPIEADSLGIPLFSSALVLMLFAALMTVGLLRASTSRWLTRLGTLSLVLASFLTLFYGLTWADSDHWPIAVSFCALALTVPLLARRAHPHALAAGSA
jgi:hypothetical protein